MQWALKVLKVGGRGFVLSYHSGEDKIVKSLFRSHTTSKDVTGLPIEVDIPKFKIVRPMARKSSTAETTANS